MLLYTKHVALELQHSIYKACYIMFKYYCLKQQQQQKVTFLVLFTVLLLKTEEEKKNNIYFSYVKGALDFLRNSLLFLLTSL